MQPNLSYILLVFCLAIGINSHAQVVKSEKDSTTAKIKTSKKLSAKNDSLILKQKDTTSLDSIKPKEAINDIIKHDAKDYTLRDAVKQSLTLYNEAHVVYEDIDLKAGIIIINNKNSTLFAKGIKDSLGYTQRPVFTQGGQESEQDSLIYNFDTKKALIYGIRTTQDPGVYVLGEKAKRVNDSTIYMRRLKFTTSDKRNPDYYIGVNKAKFVPGKKVILGTSNLVIADVPTPLFLPFAYFPLGDKRSSGFIIPAFNQSSSDRGIGIQNGGYYLAVNDYVDLEILGDLYSNGSWAFRGTSAYVKRYKFNGIFSFSFEKTIQGIRGFDDYAENTNFNVRWSHNQDQKSSPYSRFSASVNLGSSSFFRQSINEFSNSNFLNNTFNSSINYSNQLKGTPFNLNVSANHTQNTNTGDVNMTLPSIQVNMDRLFPFQGKGGVKRNALQKIGLNYNMRGEYRIATKDSLFFKPEMFKSARSGVQHNASAGTNLKLLKYFTLSPSANYKEVWSLDYIDRNYDPTIQNADGSLGGVVKDTVLGFKAFREYNAGVSLSTNIYGTFNINKGRLKAIRHTIRPTISYSYSPDFSNIYNRTVQQSSNPNDLLTYSPFEESIYGRPSAGVSNIVSFGVNNVLEAKVAPKDPDSDKEDEKITILNNLNFSTSYNIAADSLRWSNVNVSAGTRLFKDKLALNLAASLDPYQVNRTTGLNINKFNKGLFRIATANLTMNYTISSKDLEKDKEDDEDNKNNQGNGNQNAPDVYGAAINPNNRFLAAQQNVANQSRGNKNQEAKLYQANMPWSLNLAYSGTYVNNGVRNIGVSIHTIGFSGKLDLTPKWNIGFSSGYDILDGAFSYTRLNFSRDLDSWNFNFNWVPFGFNQSYTFFIGVKSSVLSDLKWDKNRPPDRVLF